MARRSRSRHCRHDWCLRRRALPRVLGALKQVSDARRWWSACLVAVVWLYLTDRQLPGHRFALLPARSARAGRTNRDFQIEGIRNVTDEQIVQVFGRDFGRSIYLCPIRERRLKLLGIDWVKEASISRLWPNRLVIRIKERTPAAFVQMPAADGACCCRWWMPRACCWIRNAPGLSAFLCSPASHDPKARPAAASA